MKTLIKFLPFIFLCFAGCELNLDPVNYSLSDVTVITPNVKIECQGYWPDGKLCVVKKGIDFQMFWGEADSYRTTAATPYVEDHINQVLKENKVFGKTSNEPKIQNINENGSWFIGVFPLNDSGRYVGFFHGESHWDSSGIAHKSIGVAYSDDYGKTWHDSAPIIVDKPKPSNPNWTGLGDGCVVRDEKNGRWVCYFQAPVGRNSNSLCMAVSYDEEGKSGTWYKWDGSDFSIKAYDENTGKGGRNVALRNLNKVPGANPSVMWNTYLNKWVMTYASWGKRIYISQSKDGINWSSPQQILGSDEHPAWYPNLISEGGDTTGGQTVQIYFSLDQNQWGVRKIGKCTITFE